jgi:hypothetical protein
MYLVVPDQYVATVYPGSALNKDSQIPGTDYEALQDTMYIWRPPCWKKSSTIFSLCDPPQHRAQEIRLEHSYPMVQVIQYVVWLVKPQKMV